MRDRSRLAIAAMALTLDCAEYGTILGVRTSHTCGLGGLGSMRRATAAGYRLIEQRQIDGIAHLTITQIARVKAIVAIVDR